MSPHEPINILNETTRFEKGNGLFRVFTAVGIAASLGSVGAALALGQHGLQDWLQSWVMAVMFWCSIALGGLFLVLIHHLTHAGWSVVVRRLAEFAACTLPLLGLLALPLLVLSTNLYEWVDPSADQWAHHSAEGDQHAVAADASDEHPDAAPAGDGHDHGAHGEASAMSTHERHRAQHIHLLESKAWYLNVGFFIARIVFAFVVLSLIAWWLFRRSTDQDLTGDPKITNKMEKWSPPFMFLFALCLTILAFDLLMALDPAWYSTIFAVYYFAGCVVGSMAFLILLGRFLQANGVLKNAITTEHYHDLGKLMFAFMIFWGYIAFSQYMLIWYGSIPEETAWYYMKASDDPMAWTSGWNYVSFALLFGHLLIPILGFMSRYVKRNTAGLMFWAAWMLFFHYLDLYWIVRPNFYTTEIPVSLLAADALALIGVGGFVVGMVFKLSNEFRSCPIGDPRINESLAFENH